MIMVSVLVYVMKIEVSTSMRVNAKVAREKHHGMLKDKNVLSIEFLGVEEEAENLLSRTVLMDIKWLRAHV